MKKITLALFAALGTVGSIFAQVNVAVQAPLANTLSDFRAPNGTTDYKYCTGMYLIKASELTSLTGSLVNQIGFMCANGTATAPAVGNFTIYLENTNDVTFTKTLSFNTATVGMATHYIGSMTIPVNTNTLAIPFNCTPTFTYNGGGIYVGFRWEETSPAVNTNTDPATYFASNVGTGNALGATGTSTATALAAETMTASDYRPAFNFTVVNTATLEVGVSRVTAMGKVSKLAALPQTVTCLVKNSSIGAQANIAVGFSVAGANNFTDIKTISSLAAGASTLISFSPFIATNNGINNMSVGVLPDANTNNNLAVWDQSVSCNGAGIPPSAYTSSVYTSQGYGAGSAAAGIIYAFKYTTGNAPSNLNGMTVVIPSFANAANLGKQLYPVLCDVGGNIVATGNTLTVGASNMDVVQTLSFPSPYPSMTANTPYMLGVATTTNGHFPIGSDGGAGVAGYYRIPVVGGAPTAVDYGYLSLEGILSFSNTNISVAASKTVVCKQGAAVTLTASGVSTYTITGPQGVVSNTNGIANATPSITGIAGAVNYTVNGSDGASGCKAAQSVITISLATCAGVATEEDGNFDVMLYPNPAVNGKAVITGLEGVNTISAINVLGQVVLTVKATEENAAIDLSNQPVGNYLIKITDSANKSRVLKLVVQN